jgi:membrane-associated phospholipid phosphatase
MTTYTRAALTCLGLAALLAASTAAGVFVALDIELALGLELPYEIDGWPLAALFGQWPSLAVLAVAALAWRRLALKVAVLAGVALVVVGLIDVAGKLWLEQPAGILAQDLPLFGYVAWSLPSGHAARAAMAAALLLPLLPRALRPVPFAIAAFLVGGAITHGHHYLTDLVVGGLLGAASGLWVVARTLDRRSLTSQAAGALRAARRTGLRAWRGGLALVRRRRATPALERERRRRVRGAGAAAVVLALLGAMATIAAAWAATRDACTGPECWADPVVWVALAGATWAFWLAGSAAATVAHER